MTTTQYFVRDFFAGNPRQVWQFVDGQAIQLGTSGPAAQFMGKPGETFFDCMKRETPWLEAGVTEGQFYQLLLPPGEYHPRVARPLTLGIHSAIPSMYCPGSIIEDAAYLADARAQLTLLMRRLLTICQTVQPTAANLGSYGHEIRNLLILASTEFEMHCRGVLQANGYSAMRPNSNDYVKLLVPLKLSEYSIRYVDFPDMSMVEPFKSWSAKDPTQSLQWYDAYNAVKHNRENDFKRGTLLCVFEALSACIAVHVAQFGGFGLNSELSTNVLVSYPEWPLSDTYIPSFEGDPWRVVSLPNL